MLDKHTVVIGEQRQQMMEQLDTTNPPPLRELISILVVPLAKHVEHGDKGLEYLLIMRQLQTSARYSSLMYQRMMTVPEVARLDKMIGRAVGSSDRGKLRAKMLIVQAMLMHGLGSFYTSKFSKDSKGFVDTLISSIVAVLADGNHPQIVGKRTNPE